MIHIAVYSQSDQFHRAVSGTIGDDLVVQVRLRSVGQA